MMPAFSIASILAATVGGEIKTRAAMVLIGVRAFSCKMERISRSVRSSRFFIKGKTSAERSAVIWILAFVFEKRESGFRFPYICYFTLKNEKKQEDFYFLKRKNRYILNFFVNDEKGFTKKVLRPMIIGCIQERTGRKGVIFCTCQISETDSPRGGIGGFWL